MGKASKAVPFSMMGELAYVYTATTIGERILPNAVIPPHIQTTPLNEWFHGLQTSVEGAAVYTSNRRIFNG